MRDLNSRSYDMEIMDDLECSGPVLDQTLHELEFINKWLGGNAVTINAVAEIFRHLPRDRTYRIADVGCGGGDMAKLIHRWGVKNGYDLEVLGIDANINAVEFARNHAKGISSVSFEAMNIFSEEFRRLKFDVVTGTLFYHHFTKEELVDFFKGFTNQVSLAFVINDIHRHPLAYHSIKLLTSLFSKSGMVRNDAPLSVRRAFTKNELVGILNEAGFTNLSIRWRWAFRWEVIVRIK